MTKEGEIEGPGGAAPKVDMHAAGDSFVGRVSTLHEITLQIDTARSYDEVMRIVEHEVRWVVPHEVCYACLFDGARSTYVISALSRGDAAAALDGLRLPASEGIAGTVILNQSPLFVDLDAAEGEERYARAESVERVLRNAGLRSMMVVPITTGDKTLGALAFASTQSSGYQEQDLVLAQLLATQVGIALTSTAMFEDAKKRIAQIEMVYDLAEDLTSTLELDELLRTAADTIRKAFGYYDVTIFLADKEHKEAVLVAHAGVHPELLPQGYRQKYNEGIVGWAISRDERVLVADVQHDGRYIANVPGETRSELAIPIHVAHAIVGVLNVEDVRTAAFDETDAIVLETLSDQLGSAIRNAQLYDELKQTNAKLTELDRMKSDFLGIVSHDFRSPLSSIVLAAKALQNRPDAMDQRRMREYLQIIVDQADKLIYMAEDTLSVTKMEAGQLNYFFNTVNIERVVKDALASVSPSRRHTVEIAIDPKMAYVRGDQMKLRQVLQNLIANAVKYSPAGGRISIRACRHSAEHVKISVSDEGIGIPEGQISRLFQKFSRVDTPAAREIKGSGLGLWICREIVKAHGGQIWVESQLGKGSDFSFTLKKAHPDEVS
jgi:signal transduction histidine kinase